jgi:hypothetical protein
MTDTRIDARARIVDTVDGAYMVLVAGVQWSPTGQPRDRSGAGYSTFATIDGARRAYLESERRLRAAAK